MRPDGISLRLSVTDACQLRCVYCRAKRGEAVRGGRLERDELKTLLAAIQQTVPIRKLRFTGGEPLLRKDLVELVADCSSLGIEDLALTSNGQRLAPLADRLKAAGLKRINFSLDSLDEETYRTVTRGGKLADSLAGIDAAKDAGFSPLKLNMVVMRGVNDGDVGAMVDFALERQIHVRFLELMPIGVAASRFDEQFVPWRELYDRLSGNYSLEPMVYQAGSTSRNYTIRDAKGRETVCGFIAPSSSPFCRGCDRLRLTADGHLMGCLARQDSIDLRPPLASALKGDDAPLQAAIEEAFQSKRLPHSLVKQRAMSRIGG